MAEDKKNIMKSIHEIELEINFHENRSAMHQAALRKLRKEKSLLIAKARSVKQIDKD